MTALKAIGVPEDSLLRNPDQIPFPNLPTAVQNTVGVIDEEEITSIRELMKAIDFYMEPVDLEATSNPYTGDQLSGNV